MHVCVKGGLRVLKTKKDQEEEKRDDSIPEVCEAWKARQKKKKLGLNLKTIGIFQMQILH